MVAALGVWFEAFIVCKHSMDLLGETSLTFSLRRKRKINSEKTDVQLKYDLKKWNLQKNVYLNLAPN